MADYIVVHSVKVATEFVPQTFGRLTTIGPVFWLPSGSKKEARARQVCLCECGSLGVYRNSDMASGHTTTCGCAHRDPTKTRKILYGVGVNDANYVTSANRPKEKNECPFYAIWRTMLHRCYCRKRLKRCPSYIGCTVAEEWHRFSNFRKWMEKQNWQGMHLDKDFLTDNRIYGPDTCVFIPQWLNSIFIKPKKHSSLPLGVFLHGRKYTARVYTNGIKIFLRGFPTPEAAYAAYVTAKTDYVRSRYPEIALIDPRLVEACERKLKQLTDKIPPVNAG